VGLDIHARYDHIDHIYDTLGSLGAALDAIENLPDLLTPVAGTAVGVLVAVAAEETQPVA
jgi:hypothetical protein